MKKRLVVGNWKMNLNRMSAVRLVESINEKPNVEVVVCPAFTLIKLLSGQITCGGQNCSEFDSGAYTGEVNASMLKDAGCKYVILGHSERRHHFKETDQQIQAKAISAQKNGLRTIICVGESLEIYKGGQADAHVASQLAFYKDLNPQLTVIAYEPIWAIGTGLTPTSDEIQLRIENIKKIVRFPVLYGGSVNQRNCNELAAISNVDGFLVGGASLESGPFNQIIASFK